MLIDDKWFFMQIKNYYTYSKSLPVKNSVAQKPSFKGFSKESLYRIYNDGSPEYKKIRYTFQHDVERFFEKLPSSQVDSFLQKLEEVAGFVDKEAFSSLRIYSYSLPKGFQDAIQNVERVRSDYLSGVIAERLSDIGKNKPKKIVDIGCGDGSILTNLKDRYRLSRNDVTGLEIFESNKAHGFNRITYDGENLQKAVLDASILEKGIPKTYDVALMNSILHHSKDHLPLMKEANKLLDDGGILVIEDILPDKGYDDYHTAMDNLLNIFHDTSDSPITGNYLDLDKLEQLARDSGFRIVNLEKYQTNECAAVGLKHFTAILQKI